MLKDNKRIKDYLREDRPMEKLLSKGVSSLDNNELLAILVGSGTREKNAIELSEEILKERFIGNQLLYSSIEELMEIKGIGMSKATRIISGIELGRRLGMINNFDKISYNSPESVADYFYDHYRTSNKEEFVILILDSKNKLLALDSVSTGTINSTIVHPREVFKSAIKKSANSIILVHNHPSGDPYPSKEDIQITRRLTEAGEIVGIKVLDHIVIGSNRHFSFKENNII